MLLWRNSETVKGLSRGTATMKLLQNDVESLEPSVLELTGFILTHVFVYFKGEHPLLHQHRFEATPRNT